TRAPRLPPALSPPGCACPPGHRSWLPQDDDGIPRYDLAQCGHPNDPRGPARMVSRQDLDDLDPALRTSLAHPGEHPPDGAREEGPAEVVLRSASVSRGVALCG